MNRHSNAEYWRDSVQWDVPAFLKFKNGPRFLFLPAATSVVGNRIYPELWPAIDRIYRDPSLVPPLGETLMREGGEMLHRLLSQCSRLYEPRPVGSDEDSFDRSDYDFSKIDVDLAISIGRHFDEVPSDHRGAYDHVLETLTKQLAANDLRSYWVKRNEVFGSDQWWLRMDAAFEIDVSELPPKQALFPEIDFEVPQFFPASPPAHLWNGSRQRTANRFVFGECDEELSDGARGPYRLYLREDQLMPWLDLHFPYTAPQATPPEPVLKPFTIMDYIVEQWFEADQGTSSANSAATAISKKLRAFHPEMFKRDIYAFGQTLAPQPGKDPATVLRRLFRNGPSQEKEMDPSVWDKLSQPFRGPRD